MFNQKYLKEIGKRSFSAAIPKIITSNAFHCDLLFNCIYKLSLVLRVHLLYIKLVLKNVRVLFYHQREHFITLYRLCISRYQ